MSDTKTLNRRAFTLAAAMAVLGGVTITIAACGGSGSSGSGSPTAPTPVNPADKAGTVGANHGHTAVITRAQLTGGGGLSLDIRGSSDHPHTVVLTAGDITAIAANNRVVRESTTDDGHSHSVTFN